MSKTDFPFKGKRQRITNPFITSDKLPAHDTLVPSYKVSEDGTTVHELVPETQLKRCINGRDLEISNLLYASMPENLAQLQMLDPMATAEQITTAAVRRFGTLQKQREELEAKFNSKPVEE